MQQQNQQLVVPIFKLISQVDKAKSKEAGRPIYKDIEVVEVRLAANKQTVGVFPAHEVWEWVDTPDGGREPQTYAMRFADQYRRFKATEAQAMSGTPLEELPFLPQAKRYELKALNVYTAEALASLDGQPLRNLGMNGRELKEKAQAFLANAADSAGAVALAEENARLKERISALEGNSGAVMSTDEAVPASPFASWDADDIKNWIKESGGELPRGNPTHATLVRRADELNAQIKKASSEAKAA